MYGKEGGDQGLNLAEVCAWGGAGTDLKCRNPLKTTPMIEI